MLDLDQWSTSRLLLTAARLVENAWNKELTDSGVTYAGLTVLIAVSLQGNTKAELARKVHVRPQTMGRILGRLEHHGFIARVSTQSGQKEQLFTITSAGHNVVTQTAGTEQRIWRDNLLLHQKLRQLLQDIITQLTRQR